MNDPQARREALNIQQSFLVQAPAGSGKTELLTQRFLKLLTVVKSPEEIIAITFTRKAAAEMRERILYALHRVVQQNKPSEPHKQLTYELAEQALQCDLQHNWQIIHNPNRLRILTIDALAGFLSAQIPILAGFGSKPDISDDVGPLYEVAARELIHSMTADTPWRPQLETLLLHLDNQMPRVIELLCAILAKREQWLTHIFNDHQQLDAGLIHIAEETIAHFMQVCGKERCQILFKLGQQAAAHLIEAGVDQHPLLCLLETDSLEPHAEQLSLWQALCDLVLTQKDEWRKSVTKTLGFPAKTPLKEQMTALLESFHDDEALLHAFIELRMCPPLFYNATQQAMITALLQLLPILYAQLRIVFQQHNQIDFVELNLAALRALGESDEPTDLALYLDHQIQHLLIDEFQDTSITQYTLLERLTRGWEPGDGRSLFLVGDPMQSIYRFRDAEVGLFIRAASQPINDIHLQRLTLHHNYRSVTAIIDWVNNQFQTIFPPLADMTQGAVPYTPSQAMKSSTATAVHAYTLVDSEAHQEAQQVRNIIQQLQQTEPEASIAILVRSRKQLIPIIRELNQQHIAFQAVDLETLYDCTAVQDLVTLTRALSHREDRLAWLALLRSPCCGLTLADLHLISQQHSQHTIWQRLQQCTLLSTDGQTRVHHLVNVLSAFFKEQGRKPIELALHGIWVALGFPEFINKQQQDNCHRFFELVAEIAGRGTNWHIDQLIKALKKCYVKPQSTASQLSIMTIHKSKGLEFNHVILPGLNNSTARNKQDLMLWNERPNHHGGIDLILAPIKAAAIQTDPTYRYLQRLENTKLNYESARLLYVAVTRAKESLHLIASVQSRDDGELSFKPNTFADYLRETLLNHIHESQTPATTTTTTATSAIQRIPAHWQPAISLPPLQSTPRENPLPPHTDSWHRHTGTVIHELLAYPNKRELAYAKRRLQQLGVTASHLMQALDMIQLTLNNIEHDPRAQWIFDPSHSAAVNEYAVTTLIDDKVLHLVIDRSFIDSAGQRWIIDYKTATPQPQQTATDFLAEQEALYRPQLLRYAEAMQGLDTHPLRTALYFPVCKLWCEVDHSLLTTAPL